jgi:TolB-like protein
MATVYLAQDLKHDRPVALKVLLPELAASLGPERFQREIKLAARLQHPHVLTVHDSGETAGQLWFTMPFVEGESLRDRLRRERQLPVDDAVRIAREAAQALQYAHDHGVVHRDIKPENLLLTADGNTLVADFGIARALGGDEHLTQTGMSVGTPAYMSPEQAAGDKALDARSDVYSLGTVLYEMLAGEPPFTGPTAQAIIAQRFSSAAPSVRKKRSSVPEAVDQAVQRALAMVPADRYATAADFARVLQPASVSGATPVEMVATSARPASQPPVQVRRRIPVAAAALALGFLIGLGVLFAWRRSHAGADDSTGPKRVAVLPFENLGDSADAYFADGITDEVRGKLSELSGLAVIARASSNQYRNTTKAPQEIARELGADYLLTATVRWEKAAGRASRVRVIPELTRVAPGAAPTTTWQQGFDASLTEVFQVQAEIAGKVASALNVALGDSARQELATRPTANLEAYDAYLKGRTTGGSNDPQTIRRIIAHYERAVALDSTFAEAWARLSRVRSYLYLNGTPTPALAAQAKAAAERARVLAPGHPATWLALGTYYASVLLDNRQAIGAFQTGLKLSPNNPDLLFEMAAAEVALGNVEPALESFSRLAVLDPRSMPAQSGRAGALLLLRRYAEAAPAADVALALNPASLSLIQQRATVALAQGDLPGARAVMRAAATRVDRDALLAYFAVYQDLYWVLDEAEQQQLLSLPLSAFDGDRALWGLVLTQVYHQRGDAARARVYADSARLALEAQLRETPGDAQRQTLRGLALAYLGRKGEAIAAGEGGAALVPISRDAQYGPYLQHQLARIYLLVGEHEKALDRLEPLLKIPYYLSPGWLRIDPDFAALKANPRFERLIAGS